MQQNVRSKLLEAPRPQCSVLLFPPHRGLDGLLQPPTLVGLVCAAGGALVLPAKGWALEPALELLEKRCRHGGLLARSFMAWFQGAPPRPFRFAMVTGVLRELAIDGHLHPAGQGWEAGYVVDPSWRAVHVALAARLPRSESRPLGAAGQRLVASLTTWSKKAVVADAPRSDTISGP
jgi:hypothetical protein